KSSTSSSSRYYETIIPYDAAMIPNMQIASIDQALPPPEISFTVFLDSCHAGGMFLSPDSRAFTCDSAAAQPFQTACQTIIPWIRGLDAPVLDGDVSDLRLLDTGVCSMTVDSSKDTPDSAKATLLSACDYGELSGVAVKRRQGRRAMNGWFI